MNQEVKEVESVEWGRKKLGRGRNQMYLDLRNGKIPGALNLGTEDSPVWRIRTRPFLRWLNGEENPGLGTGVN